MNSDEKGFIGAKFRVFSDDDAIIVQEQEYGLGADDLVRNYVLQKAQLIELQFSGWLEKQGYRLVKIDDER
jgi:hypothetical protein